MDAVRFEDDAAWRVREHGDTVEPMERRSMARRDVA